MGIRYWIQRGGAAAHLPVLAVRSYTLCSYIAPDTDSLLADEGDLWAFVSDTPGYNNYYDFTPGSSQVVTGHFEQVQITPVMVNRTLRTNAQAGSSSC